MKEFIEVGEFVTTHGIGGELKLYPWCDTPEFVATLSRVFFSEAGAKETKIETVRVHKGMCLIQLKDVHTIEAARIYLRRTVYCARADVTLPQGRWFMQDLIGCEVRDAQTGETYGTLTEISHPANIDLYTIKNSAGAEYLFPAVPEFLGEITPENNLITVRPIPGMFGAIQEDEDAD